jgi:hypothetical protein
LPLDHANDVGASQSTEPVEVLICVSEAAAIISIMKNASEGEVVEDAALYVGFFQEIGGFLLKRILPSLIVNGRTYV